MWLLWVCRVRVNYYYLYYYLSPSSVHPRHLRTVSWCLLQTLLQTCWGSLGRWQSLDRGNWASFQFVGPSGSYHSLEVQTVEYPSRVYNLWDGDDRWENARKKGGTQGRNELSIRGRRECHKRKTSEWAEEKGRMWEDEGNAMQEACKGEKEDGVQDRGQNGSKKFISLQG